MTPFQMIIFGLPMLYGVAFIAIGIAVLAMRFTRKPRHTEERLP